MASSWGKTPEAPPTEIFLEKNVLKICSKFTGEHPCQSAIPIERFQYSHTLVWVFSCKLAA